MPLLRRCVLLSITLPVLIFLSGCIPSAQSEKKAAVQDMSSVPNDGVNINSPFKEILKAAEGGNATAQYWVGLEYQIGKNVPQNTSKAEDWFRKSATQGYAAAMASLGQSFHSVPLERHDWAMKAAMQGNSQSMFQVVLDYDSGLGVPKNTFQTYVWANVERAFSTVWASRTYSERAASLLTISQIQDAEQASNKLFEEIKANHRKQCKKFPDFPCKQEHLDE